MHPCLNVDEIVRLIAHELVVSSGERSAVSLACCCKSLEDPALDALWAKQESLYPLLESLPSDVCQWKEGGHNSFKRLPTTTEWARFRSYARRMRELRQRGTLKTKALSAMQLCVINEPLFPNLKTFELTRIDGSLVPFIPLFLSPRTTSITLGFESNHFFKSVSDHPKAVTPSMIATLPTLCPDLEVVTFHNLPRNPMISAAVSEMLLITNRNTLQELRVDSPLTDEASAVVYELPNLRGLSVVIEKGTRLPSASLPNLTELTIRCDGEDDWPRLFHGATFGKLESITFLVHSKGIDNFLGVFERAALSSSVQNTLSKFSSFTHHPWDPNYPSLLPFTQMVDLDIGFFCDEGCTSKVDDDIVISLSRAMPKLESPALGDRPCDQIGGGVMTKGLLALAYHCPKLSTLCVHLQVASLSDPSGTHETVPNAGSAALRTDCALTELEVGATPVPEWSAMTIILTLLRIFPRLNNIAFSCEGEWRGITRAIHRSGVIVENSRAALETSG